MDQSGQRARSLEDLRCFPVFGAEGCNACWRDPKFIDFGDARCSERRGQKGAQLAENVSRFTEGGMEFKPDEDVPCLITVENRSQSLPIHLTRDVLCQKFAPDQHEVGFGRGKDCNIPGAEWSGGFRMTIQYLYASVKKAFALFRDPRGKGMLCI